MKERLHSFRRTLALGIGVFLLALPPTVEAQKGKKGKGSANVPATAEVSNDINFKLRGDGMQTENNPGFSLYDPGILDDCVGVRVNGPHYDVGDGVKTENAYFSRDGGTTALAIGTILAGDTLFWNGTISGFELGATDRVSLEYNAA